MLPMEEEEMEMPLEEGMEGEDPSAMLREELKEWAKLQMSKDMATRNGKALPMEEGMELEAGAEVELPLEGGEGEDFAPVPGVEGEEEMGMPAEGGGDMAKAEKLKALLAQLKAG